MLPQSATNGSSRPAAAAAVPSPPAVDNRQFEYRFSMAYVRNLPEAQRPVEREVFGEQKLDIHVIHVCANFNAPG